MCLVGKVELGTDVFGNIQRLDNALEGLPDKLKVTKGNLEETKKQLETAKEELQKEFPQEEELQTKIKRPAEVDALLNMEKKTTRVQHLSRLMNRKCHRKKW